MGKQRKLLVIGVFIFIDILLISGILVVRDYTLKNILIKEVSSLSSLDITKDRYNKKVKSSGKYGVVEKTIKSYLDDYAVQVQNVLSDSDSESLLMLLSVESIEKKSFDDLVSEVEFCRNDFIYNIDTLIEKSNRENAYLAIKDHYYDGKYARLYEKLMEDNNFINTIENTRLLLEKKKVEKNDFYDSMIGVFELLKNNKYVVDEGKVKFDDVDVQNSYNVLESKIKRI